MYTDIAKWQRVRRLILVDGKSKTMVAKTENIGFRTIQKMLLYDEPPGCQYDKAPEKRISSSYINLIKKLVEENHRQPESSRLSSTRIFQILQGQGFPGSLATVYYYRRRLEDTDEADLWQKVQHIASRLPNRSGAKFLSSLFSPGTLNGNSKAAKQRRDKIHSEFKELTSSKVYRQSATQMHWERWLSDLERTGKYQSDLLTTENIRYLLKKLSPEKNNSRKKALTILAQDQNISPKSLAKLLGISSTATYNYINLLALKGVEGPFVGRIKEKKEDSEIIKKLVFSLLHEPPSLSGLNRTSWRMADLERILKEKGVFVSGTVLHNIIKKAGYKWKSARIVLTSHDPDYREKLTRLQKILSNLQDDERFFSIDEFGPFTVKMRPGCRLTPPEVFPVVPQVQTSKGLLICTAALELSRNQVTHFFSPAKNSREMVRLARVLIEKYAYTKKLYLSWDAASWHKSRTLQNFLDAHNLNAVFEKLPVLEIVTLPAGAQFLNIIESVFSGMARAIIHNSDYASKEAAMHAIDCYFSERNQHYADHPKAAGKKIWGMERTSNKFAPENNCKDPAFR